MKKRGIIVAGLILSPLILIFLIRLINPSELDDVTPEISCSSKLLEKANTLWIIPKFNNIPISDNPEWCNKILSLNKTLGLHGLYHQPFEEFDKEINQEYIQEAIAIFEDCFHQTPTMFKPPQLKISKENKILIKQNNLKLKEEINQATHKVYHCSDTGKFSNKFINYF